MVIRLERFFSLSLCPSSRIRLNNFQLGLPCSQMLLWLKWFINFVKLFFSYHLKNLCQVSPSRHKQSSYLVPCTPHIATAFTIPHPYRTTVAYHVSTLADVALSPLYQLILYLHRLLIFASLSSRYRSILPRLLYVPLRANTYSGATVTSLKGESGTACMFNKSNINSCLFMEIR